MRTDRELFEWLEAERRKYALLFSVKPKAVRKTPRGWALGMPLLLLGFIVLLIVQQSYISELKTDNHELEQNLTALHERNDWYRETLDKQVRSAADTAARATARQSSQPLRSSAQSLTQESVAHDAPQGQIAQQPSQSERVPAPTPMADGRMPSVPQDAYQGAYQGVYPGARPQDAQSDAQEGGTQYPQYGQEPVNPADSQSYPGPANQELGYEDLPYPQGPIKYD